MGFGRVDFYVFWDGGLKPMGLSTEMTKILNFKVGVRIFVYAIVVGKLNENTFDYYAWDII